MIKNIHIPKRLKAITNNSIVQKHNSTAQFIVDHIKDKHFCEIDLIFLTDSKLYLETLQSRDYDIRIGSVDAGTQAGHWVTEMMFCTKQGISFIDPENEIEKKLKVADKDNNNEIGEIVNNALSKHKHIVPLFNKSFTVYVGRHIDTKSVSANNTTIRCELIKIIA